MRARYYYNADTGFAYKVAGDGVCPAKLDVNMWHLFGANRTTVRIIGRRLKHDMTRSHMWEPMDILGANVVLYLGN